MPVYPVPTPTYMGIHVTPTVDGNVIVGPDAEVVSDFTYYGVEQKSMDFLAESARTLWPHINKVDYIRNYSGIQPKWLDYEGVVEDFVIEARSEAPHTINLIGIESPGLTCALPIARRVVKLLAEHEDLKPNKNFNPKHKGIVRFSQQTDDEKARLIKQDPN